MLLEFECENYKSFSQPLKFSMEPDGISELKSSLLHDTADGKACTALSSSVIFGPNGSGKTSILEAMDTLRSLVIRGHIKNVAREGKTNLSACSLETIPTFPDGAQKPVKFRIRFVVGHKLIEYTLHLLIPGPSCESRGRQILQEELSVSRQMIFRRKEDGLELGRTEVLRHWMEPDAIRSLNSLRNILNKGLRQEDLFLSGGLHTTLIPDLAREILNWFEKDMIILYQNEDSRNSLRMEPILQMESSKEDRIRVDEDLSAIARSFGSRSTRIAMLLTGYDNPPQFLSVIEDENSSFLFPLEEVESRGLVNLLRCLPVMAMALDRGSVLLIDEFENSLHPQALKSIAALFHNPDINRHNAQLIFSTHNPVFMDGNLYRRDEIKFCAYDSEKKTSRAYSLADFGTSSSRGVRKGEAYLNNYFNGKYGAIEDMDFTDTFRRILEHCREGLE